MQHGERGKNALIQALLIANAFLMLYPLLVMILSAFKTNAELFASPFALPESFAGANFARMWSETSFLRYLGNSIAVTAVSVGLIVVFGTMAAYAIARYPFRLSAAVFLFFLSGLMVPLKLTGDISRSFSADVGAVPRLPTPKSKLTNPVLPLSSCRVEDGESA